MEKKIMTKYKNKFNLKNILSITAVLLLLSFITSPVFAQFGMRKDIVNMKSYLSLNKVYAGSEFKLGVKLNIEKTWHINSNKPHDEFLIPSGLTIDSSGYFSIDKIVYPHPKDIKLAFSDRPLSVWEGEILIGGLIKVSKDIEPGKYPIVVEFNYQSCNDQTCLPPVTVKDTLLVEVAGKKSAVQEINQDIFKNIDLSYSPVVSSQAGEGGISSTLEKSGLLLSLIFVFLGGLALNLTPCVYPLIPITVGFFGGQSEGKTTKLFGMGLLYLVGLALTYSVIGVITALSGAVFGSLLQNTFVIISIVLIFIALSLSMFGVYEFKMPDSWVAKAGGAKSGYYGAFFMGLTMGIVAAPCIGPFVLGLVTYVAAKGDPVYGFLMFFVLALGLGMPYLFLAVFSGKIKKLPRSGIWMEAVKHIFGFILLGMALYFLLPVLPESFSGYVLPVFMLITAGYLLFIDKMANNLKAFRIFKTAFSIVLIAVAVYSLIPSEKNSIDWKPYTSSAVAATVKSDKGTIIDFYADWCIPCKELDASTFSNPEVIAASKNFRAFKADMTKSLSPEVEELRDKYKIVGVPTVLIIGKNGREAKRITGYVSANEFYNILKKIE
jgi:thiol:disulfide interchange protein DsbD